MTGYGWGSEGLRGSGECVCALGVRGGGGLTFSQRLAQGYLMPVYHHIPKLLFQLFADAQAVHCMGAGVDRAMEQG